MLRVKGQEYKSKTHENGGKNPCWNEEFNIKCTDPSEILEVRIMEDGGILNDDDIGRCQIKLSQFMYGKGISEWFVLLWKNKKAGEILIQSIW